MTRIFPLKTINNDRKPGRFSPSLSQGEHKYYTLMAITDREFDRMRELVHHYFGIKLPDEKRSLVVGRLQNYLKQRGINNFESYIDLIESDKSGHELIRLIDHISTNHTYFFREKDHFDFLLLHVLPEIEARIKENHRHEIRIWSAGCSGGDEAYSFAMCLMDYWGDNYSKLNAGVLATDISEKILEEARQGVYAKTRITHVPRMYLSRFFKACENGLYEIHPKIKQEVTFRRLNLKNKEFPFKQAFDVISCRNVMIYFEEGMKDDLVNNLYELTRPGGYLFIGHSEALNRKKIRYSYFKPGVYKRG